MYDLFSSLANQMCHCVSQNAGNVMTVKCEVAVQLFQLQKNASHWEFTQVPTVATHAFS